MPAVDNTEGCSLAKALAPTAGQVTRITASLHADLCVIGAGSGGLTVAAGAAQLGANVVLVERGEMGGDCLNYGCVPSKSLLAAAKLATAWRCGTELGIEYLPPRIDFAAVGDSVERVVARIAPNDSVERFEHLGVRVLRAEARFTGPNTVLAGDVTIRARRFVIATGAAPIVPPIPGLDAVPYMTNETVFANRELPRHLIVIGGGPIGVEMAQAHRRLGAEVTIIDAGPLLPRDDAELAAALVGLLAEEGVVARAATAITGIQREGTDIAVLLADGRRIVGSHLLIAAGRRPNVAALDLVAAGIATGEGGITVDNRLRTTNRRAYAIGDVVGGPQFTHIAAYHAGIVIRNALFRVPARVDYSALPWVTYSDPELAQIGLTESAARAGNSGDIRVLRWSFAENDRAQTERDTEGQVKIIIRSNGRILGATILGRGAGDLILPWALAISQNLKIGAFATLMVPYPTRGDASKRAAGTFYTPKLFSPGTRRLVRALSWFG
jgi:pyruvate/2-oxoglutarate dehydrogenase complex dihydrolipoamide dehydrogenase (E3) component